MVVREDEGGEDEGGEADVAGLVRAHTQVPLLRLPAAASAAAWARLQSGVQSGVQGGVQSGVQGGVQSGVQRVLREVLWCRAAPRFSEARDIGEIWARCRGDMGEI